MAFRFPLQALLRLRQASEDREKLRLAAISTRLFQRRSLFEELNQKRQQAGADLENLMRSGLLSSEVQFDVLGMQVDSRRLQTLMMEIAKLEQARLTQQNVYLDAKKKRESLESLRTRQMEAYQLVQAKHEQQQVDDLFTTRRNFNTQRK